MVTVTAFFEEGNLYRAFKEPIIIISGDRLPVLLIKTIDIHRSGCRRVLPAAVEPAVRSDEGAATALQPHSRHHTEYRHLPHLYNILQRLRNGR